MLRVVRCEKPNLGAHGHHPNPQPQGPFQKHMDAGGDDPEAFDAKFSGSGTLFPRLQREQAYRMQLKTRVGGRQDAEAKLSGHQRYKLNLYKSWSRSGGPLSSSHPERLPGSVKQ